jgi:DNA-binding response OmpR family regulator
VSKLKKALIIEDTASVQNTFVIYFRALGWAAPMIVAKGEEALDILQDPANTFDVIILDQKLPGKSGVATLAAARQTIENLPPVIMITGIDETEVFSALAERELSVDAFMPKSKLKNFRMLGELLAQVLERA